MCNSDYRKSGTVAVYALATEESRVVGRYRVTQAVEVWDNRVCVRCQAVFHSVKVSRNPPASVEVLLMSFVFSELGAHLDDFVQVYILDFLFDIVCKAREVS